ncbi:MAG: YHS domain-containing protein [Elusimicrobia bacterium]|nr:YHS domain-containing protein [Elusimicrobiota bacterium]
MSTALLSPRACCPPSAARGAASGWMGWAALAFPWLAAVTVLGLIVLDRGRAGTTLYLDAAEMARTGAAAGAGAAAKDPVCGMEVRRASAEKAVYEGASYHFCSTYCRDEFIQAPGRYAALQGSPRAGHSMRGLPTRLYQWALAGLLLLSFGLMEWRAGSADARASAMSARLDLTAWPPLRRLLASAPALFALRVGMAALFALVLAAGLFGAQNPGMNLAPLLTWTVWWTGLVFVVLYLGKAWCTVCPWDALATWAERLKAWGPRGEGTGLSLPWPRALRNIWFAVALFVLLTWIELGMGITLIPRATAWVGLGMLGLALACAFLFERRAFCRYGCLVGRVSGLYALFSPLEVRASSPEACASCRTLDCWRGNARADGCPTFEFPRVMRLNTYCTLCAECLRSCPKDNMSVRLRPWGADLAFEGKPRGDEAALALILLSMTAFHGLTMTPSWVALLDAARAATGLSFIAAFTGLMALFLAAPAAAFAALAALSARWSGASFGPVFLRFAYALLPIALFYHLAHNAQHFLFEGPKVAALASDPFGWGWDLFGTARWQPPPLVTLEGLWRIQVLFVLLGHVYSLWLTARSARRLAADRGASLRLQAPMLLAMIAFSWASLWLLKQPMELRASAL